MDVNLVLHEIRELCGEVAALKDEMNSRPLAWTAVQAKLARVAVLGGEIAERFDALDQHMSAAGEKPDAWREMEDHR